MVSEGLCSIAETRPHGVWVTAFAGTTNEFFSPGHDGEKNFVNAMFTTFVRVRFTNVFE